MAKGAAHEDAALGQGQGVDAFPDSQPLQQHGLKGRSIGNASPPFARRIPGGREGGAAQPPGQGILLPRRIRSGFGKPEVQGAASLGSGGVAQAEGAAAFFG